jgi:hypothetical protein
VFAEDLSRHWGQLFGPLRATDGLTTACDRAEPRPGLSLPLQLREFYRLLGRNRVAMGAHMRFYSPADLVVERGGLVFCEENQRVYFNAVRVRQLNQDDPPVVQGNDQEEKWYAECRQLSTFLLKSLCWQAISGLPAGGTAKVVRALLEKATGVLARVGNAKSYNHELRAYTDEGLVICTFPKNGALYAASNSDDRLRQFEQDTGVESDWL